MTAEEFERATEMELLRRANQCLAKFDESGSHERPALLIEAQLYMDEIERRKQGKIAKRTYILEKLAILLEVIVIVLIVLELVEGRGQSKALDALAKSATATAASVESLQKEQDQATHIQTDMLHAIEQLHAANQPALPPPARAAKRRH
jgi:hypothetical protein